MTHQDTTGFVVCQSPTVTCSLAGISLSGHAILYPLLPLKTKSPHILRYFRNMICMKGAIVTYLWFVETHCANICSCNWVGQICSNAPTKAVNMNVTKAGFVFMRKEMYSLHLSGPEDLHIFGECKQ